MNPEELELLKKTAALTEENNAILHKMQKSSLMTRNFKIGYWILIIILSIFGIWCFQTYIGSIQSAFSQSGLTNGTSTSGSNTQSSSGIDSLMQSL